MIKRMDLDSGGKTMQFHIRDFQWTRQPKAVTVRDNRVEIVTDECGL